MSTSDKRRKALEQVQDIRSDALPGALFRRLHQQAVARFTSEMGDIGLTPIQWFALLTTMQRPGIDQITLSRDIFVDPSTMPGVLDRLEFRGLLQRAASPDDRRVRLLHVTEKGRAVLKDANVAVLGVQEWLMEPLSPAERGTLIALMLRLLNRPE